MTISIAMVALGDEAKVTAKGIQQYWQENWPGEPTPSNPEKQDHTLSFRVGDADVIYGLMPAPLPDVEPLCENNWLWEEAATEIQAQRTHVIVTVSSEGGPRDRSVLLTQATAALAGSCGSAVAVLWCDSRVLMKAELFCEFATQILPDGNPLFIWVDFRAGPKDGQTAGFTNGLQALGLMEIETLDATESVGDVRQRFYGLADYLIENGPVINDGDTVGESTRERIKVVYRESEFGHEGQVMRLEYGHEESAVGGGLTLYGYLHLGGTILVTLACATGLFWLLGGWVSNILLRILILVLPTLVGGFLLLVISDKILNSVFGLDAFKD